MGTDYLSCSGCTAGFRDDDEYSRWCDCGSKFCCQGCAKLENYFNPFSTAFKEKIEDDDPRYDAWEEGNYSIEKDKPITCVICRKERANDLVLFEALLEHYKITREEAFEIYKSQKG